MICDVQGRFQGTKDVWLRENVVGWHRGEHTDYEKRIETFKQQLNILHSEGHRVLWKQDSGS
jgi:hypothetical protein